MIPLKMFNHISNIFLLIANHVTQVIEQTSVVKNLYRQKKVKVKQSSNLNAHLKQLQEYTMHSATSAIWTSIFQFTSNTGYLVLSRFVGWILKWQHVCLAYYSFLQLVFNLAVTLFIIVSGYRFNLWSNFVRFFVFYSCCNTLSLANT